jgi:protoporphyrinogen oxidase
MEYFLQEEDALWSASDATLIEMATEECIRLGFIEKEDVLQGVVIRMLKAYPVYDRDYEMHLERIKDYLKTISNLQLVGRNGQHRYNNQDHSMLTAIYAARNILGGEFDVWDVNLEPEYHEATGGETARGGQQLMPRHKTM